jgi:hypothetical protein
MSKDKAKDKVSIGKNLSVPRGKEQEMKKEPGGSNVGKYKNVESFAGPAGGAPEGTFPINTLARAKNALARAENAPNPEGIRRAVEKKYPSLKPEENSKKSDKKK